MIDNGAQQQIHTIEMENEHIKTQYHSVKNQPEEQKTAETRAMIETFNKAVDFVDFSALEPIAGAVR